MELRETLLSTIEQASQLIRSGQRGKAAIFFRDTYDLTLENPTLFWDEIDNLTKHGRVLMLAYLFDVYDDEETNIRCTHLAYLLMSRALILQKERVETTEKEQILVETNNLLSISKERVMLIYKCFDTFTSTFITILFSGKREFTEEERNMVNKLIAKKSISMVYYDLYNLEQYFSDFGDDEYLIELEQEIAVDRKTGQNDYTEGAKLHDLLFQYLNEKIKLDDLFF